MGGPRSWLRPTWRRWFSGPFRSPADERGKGRLAASQRVRNGPGRRCARCDSTPAIAVGGEEVVGHCSEVLIAEVQSDVACPWLNHDLSRTGRGVCEGW